jgi:putative membrane protein
MSADKFNYRTILIGSLAIAYAVMWVGGVGHYVLYGKPPLDAPWAASVFLFLAGGIVALTAKKPDFRKLFLAASFGLLAEIHGVRFGMIFSPYQYTGVLQPRILGVPLVMFSAWMVLVASTQQLFSRFPWPIWLHSLISAAWMTSIDLVIDPLAANQLAYWQWEQDGAYYGIPLHNFIGWLIVSFLIFRGIGRPRHSNPGAGMVGLTIILFFTCIAVSHRLLVPSLIGFALSLGHSFLMNPFRHLSDAFSRLPSGGALRG